MAGPVTGPHDGQSIVSAIVETASGHSESASALAGPGSGQKTTTGSNETAHGQKATVKSHGESAFVHVTVNCPWSESTTPETKLEYPETESRHRYALHEKLDPEGEISVKSASGSSLPSLQSVTDDHPLENWKTPPGQGQRAQGTPESAMIPLAPRPEGRKQLNRMRPQKPRPSWRLPPLLPPKEGKREG